MLTCQNARQCPEAFHRLFGISVKEFDALYVAFADAYARRLAQSTLTRKRSTPRKRRPGAGPHFKHTLRDRLLLALFWLRVYPTLELLGSCFSLDKTSAEDNLKDVLATLETMAEFALEHPSKHGSKRHTLEQVLEAFPDLALFLDAAPPATPRPQNPPNPPLGGSGSSAVGADSGSEDSDLPAASKRQGCSLIARLLPHKLYCTATHRLLTTEQFAANGVGRLAVGAGRRVWAVVRPILEAEWAMRKPIYMCAQRTLH